MEKALPVCENERIVKDVHSFFMWENKIIKTHHSWFVFIQVDSFALGYTDLMDDTCSVATEDSCSDKENSKAQRKAGVSEPAVILRKKRGESGGNNGREQQRQRRTLKKTRKFVVDGVVVTTTSTKIIDPNEEIRHKEDADHRLELFLHMSNVSHVLALYRLIFSLRLSVVLICLSN